MHEFKATGSPEVGYGRYELIHELFPTGLIYMLTALWQVTAMHFYLLAYLKTKLGLLHRNSLHL
jgi:hypothetical protein